MNLDERIEHLKEVRAAQQERAELEADEQHQQALEDHQVDAEYERLHSDDLIPGELPSERRRRLHSEAAGQRYQAARDESGDRSMEALFGDDAAQTGREVTSE